MTGAVYPQMKEHASHPSTGALESQDQEAKRSLTTNHRCHHSAVLLFTMLVMSQIPKLLWEQTAT